MVKFLNLPFPFHFTAMCTTLVYREIQSTKSVQCSPFKLSVQREGKKGGSRQHLVPITEFRTGMVQSVYGALKKKSSLAFTKTYVSYLNCTECSRRMRGTDEKINYAELTRSTLHPSMGWLCGLEEETGLYLAHFMITLG